MIFDKETCQKHLDAWLEADLAVAQGQSYTIGTRTLTRAHSGEIRRNIQLWSDRLAQIKRKSSGPRTIQVVPR